MSEKNVETYQVDEGLRFIGENIRVWRNRKGLKQKELAELVHVNPALICQVENGKKMLSISTLKNVADALGVSLGTLIDGEPTERGIALLLETLPKNEREEIKEWIALKVLRLNRPPTSIFSSTMADNEYLIHDSLYLEYDGLPGDEPGEPH